MCEAATVSIILVTGHTRDDILANDKSLQDDDDQYECFDDDVTDRQLVNVPQHVSTRHLGRLYICDINDTHGKNVIGRIHGAIVAATIAPTGCGHDRPVYALCNKSTT